MEDTGRNIELVHVLRHSYRPSHVLEEILEGSVQPRAERPRSLASIRSLSMIAFNAMDVANMKHANAIFKARQFVDTQTNQWFRLGEYIEVKKAGEKALAILMSVVNDDGSTNEGNLPSKYTQFTDAVNERLSDGISLRDPGDPQYSLYARLEYFTPVTDEFQQSVSKDLGDAFFALAAKGILSVSPNGLPGFDQQRSIERQKPLEEAS